MDVPERGSPTMKMGFAILIGEKSKPNLYLSINLKILSSTLEEGMGMKNWFSNFFLKRSFDHQFAYWFFCCIWGLILTKKIILDK